MLERVITAAVYEHRRATHVTITAALVGRVLGLQAQLEQSQSDTQGYL